MERDTLNATVTDRRRSCSLLSFVIPAHNEERELGATLASLESAARLVDRPSEIVVVDDASSDRTAEIAREHGAPVTSVQLRGTRSRQITCSASRRSTLHAAMPSGRATAGARPRNY